MMAAPQPKTSLIPRRLALLVFLTIVFIVLDVLIYLFYYNVVGVMLPASLFNLILLIIGVSAAGSLLAVFMLTDTALKLRGSLWGR